MNARELERLLGGYAAGTLTESEHSALMRAALDDQQLFDALADEEALRDALADPVFRARLRARLAPEAPQRSLRWLWWLAPALTAGLSLFFVLNRPEKQATMDVASVKAPARQETAAVPQSQPEPFQQPATPASTPPARKSMPAESRRDEPDATPPPPIAESVAVVPQAPAVVEERKLAKDERAPMAAEADAPTPLAAPPPPPPPPPAMAAPRPAAPPPPPAPAMAAPRPAAPAPSASREALADTATATALALELQIERAVNGRFESAELGALRQGDRVRFRVRAPEAGLLVYSDGSRSNATRVQAGQTYYLPTAEGLPPGNAPVEVAIALRSLSAQEPGSLFRARQQSTGAQAGSVAGGMRGVAKAKESSAEQRPPAPREVRLRIEFQPR